MSYFIIEEKGKKIKKAVSLPAVGICAMPESRRQEDSMTMSSMPPIQPQDTNADEIRVLGLITFVSILVGAAIGVFDAGLWLKQDGDVRTNSFTYAMAAFTLQGMSFVLYKLLMQQSLDHRASFARMDRERARKMQGMQQAMANKQMEVEMRLQEAQFMRQLQMLEYQNENDMLHMDADALLSDAEAEPSVPSHKAKKGNSIDLGGTSAVSQNNKHSVRDRSGKFAKKD